MIRTYKQQRKSLILDVLAELRYQDILSAIELMDFSDDCVTNLEQICIIDVPTERSKANEGSYLYKLLIDIENESESRLNKEEVEKYLKGRLC